MAKKITQAEINSVLNPIDEITQGIPDILRRYGNGHGDVLPEALDCLNQINLITRNLADLALRIKGQYDADQTSARIEQLNKEKEQLKAELR